MTTAFRLACPSCRTPLEQVGSDEQRCPTDGTVYRRQDGIWRFLAPERQAYYDQFILEYQTVRQGEGRGSSDPAYYRALPFQDLNGRFRDDWKIRARSFQALIHKVCVPLEHQLDRRLGVLDLGAGNGWLSHQLALRGHHVAAIDLLTNSSDGLGAHIHYHAAFIPVQAEFDHLPFTGAQADMVIFNASLHYSTCYEHTLSEALRVLEPSGQIVILDSPVYQEAESGATMVREREEKFRRDFGFASNSIPSQNYLTYQTLESLSKSLKIEWKLIRMNYGWRWELRPWKARLLGTREPAQFMLITGRRKPESLE